MNLGIEGKTALVVGASKGIGRAVASLLLDECRCMATVSRSPCTVSRFPINMDMMAEHAPQRLADTLSAADIQPDIIYHCMGGSVYGIKAWDRPWSEWERVYRFNLGVAHEINRLLVPPMLDRGWGRVVMTSTDGTASASGNPPYTSSKFALEGYVRTVAKQWVKGGVIISAVAPGNVFTPGLPMYEQGMAFNEEYWKHHVAAGRWARPEEIASAILPLCGDGASWMSGAIVRVDGGAR